MQRFHGYFLLWRSLNLSVVTAERETLMQRFHEYFLLWRSLNLSVVDLTVPIPKLSNIPGKCGTGNHEQRRNSPIYTYVPDGFCTAGAHIQLHL